MNTKLEALLDTTLSHSPAQVFFRWRAARQLTVLAYHGIDDPACFERQLDYLARTMTPVSLNEVIAAINGQAGLPKQAVLITFDDGERSLLDHGLPLLQSRGLPAVIFVVAGLLGTQQPFWWAEAKSLARQGGTAAGLAGLSPSEMTRQLKRVSDAQRLKALDQLRASAARPAPPMPQLQPADLHQLEAAGIAIGNHTTTHPCLNHCDTAKIKEEINQAHTILTTALGRHPRAFAYPNGDADQRAIPVLDELNYQAAFLFDHRPSPSPPPHRFYISRVRVNSHTPPDRFGIILSGLHPALHHLQGKA